MNSFPDPIRNPHTPAKFVRAKYLAARFGVCPKTIFRWADAGFIHRHKVTARTVLFDEAEIEAFIKSARV